MRRINPARAALSVGGVIGLYHAAWCVLVGLGWAKNLLDIVLQLHFLRFEYQLLPFHIGTAAGLVGLTFTVGAIVGLSFALIWNTLARDPADGVAGSPVRRQQAAA
jgi:hypothetical protein